MQKLFYCLLAALVLVTFMVSCHRKSVPSGDASGASSVKGQQAGAPCIIYKTRADYNKNVPVTLSEDRSKVVSFPGIRDIYYNGEFSYPVALEEGFLLDNRGIGPDVAFLSYTYEEYSKLENTPSPDILFQKILDKDPLTEMYGCGERVQYKDIVTDLNRIIKEGKLNELMRLK